MQKGRSVNGTKPFHAASSGKKSVGLFLFSFFEPQSLLKAIHRLAANNRLCTIYGIYLNNQIRNETKKSRG